MATPRFAWGIDIGNGALKAVKLAREDGQFKITDFEYIEHEQVLSNAGDNRDALIASAIANFVGRHPMRGGVAAVSVSGQQSFARFIKLPPVEEKKIPEIVRFEAIQQIPFPLDDVEWSYQLFRDPASPDVEVGIFAMRKELIERHIKQFTDVDLNVQAVQMNPLAVYNAMYHDGRLRAGTTMVIDLGAENTDLVIADGETVWLRSIPIGGNAFTEALVKAFKLNFAKAEDLKRNAATSKYARQIFQAMRPVFADLVSEIQRSIGFYASVHRDSQIKKIVAVGGTFKMPTLQKYLQQNLQIEVEKLDRFAAGSPDDPKLATALNDHLLSMTGAYGLAVQAMGEGKITSSLLPAAIRRAKMWKEKTKWFAAAAACFVAAPVVAYGAMWALHDAPYEAAQKDRADVTAIMSKAKNLDTQWAAIQDSGSADRQQIANVQGLLNYRDMWPRLMADIYQALPTPQWKSVDDIKTTPRGQRQQIVIDSIDMKYVPDMTQILKASDLDFPSQVRTLLGQQQSAGGNTGAWGGGGSGMGGMEGMEGNAGVPVDSTNVNRGLLVTITGTTPNSNGIGLVQEKLLSGLNAISAEKHGDRQYYIARATTLDSLRVTDGQLKQKLAAAGENQRKLKSGELTPGTGATGAGGSPYGGGSNPYQADPMMGGGAGGFGGGGGGAFGGGGAAWALPSGGGGNNPGATAPVINDPLTGESMNNDTEFRVAFLVIMDIPGEKPAAPANGY